MIPWLEEQARRGLFLEHVSALSWAKFRRGEPKTLQYWVHTDPDGVSLAQEVLDVYQERGWQYVDADFRLRFHIFAGEATALSPVELEGDGLRTYLAKESRVTLWSVVMLAVVGYLAYAWSRNWADWLQGGERYLFPTCVQIVLLLELFVTGWTTMLSFSGARRRCRTGALILPDRAMTPSAGRLLLYRVQAVCCCWLWRRCCSVSCCWASLPAEEKPPPRR